MEEWWNNRADNLYLDLLMLVCSIIAMIACIKNKSNSSSLFYFFIYPMSSAIQTSSCLAFEQSKPDNFFFQANVFSTALFMIVEFVSVGIFFYSEIKNKTRRAILLTIIIIYALYNVWYAAFFDIAIVYRTQFKTQSFIILFYIIVYLIDIFNNPPKAKLTDEPAFWVTIGSAILSLGTTPIVFSFSFIFDDESYLKEWFVFSLVYVLYIFVFGLITRACLCKNTKVLITNPILKDF